MAIKDWPGGVISKTPVVPSGGYINSTASGVWTLDQAAYWTKQQQWPGTAVGDPYFYDVTLLLTGDGTNGAQNNTFLDSSTNNFTITRNGNTTQGTFSPYGNLWSNYFDGSGDYLNIAQNAAFGFGTGDFSLEFWAFIVDYTRNNTILDTRTGGAGLVIGMFPNGAVNVYAAGDRTTASGLYPSNQWVHIAVTRSGTTLRTFINGVMQGYFTSISTDFGSSNVIRIGYQTDNANYCYGYISNLRIIKGSIPTSYQTSETSTGTSVFTPSTTPLTAVSGTSLLTCQSNRFIDNSSNNFTLTVNGNTSVQRFSPFNPTAPYSESTIGGSGYFDGTGDYLSVGSAANWTFLNNGSDWTVEFDVFHSSTSQLVVVSTTTTTAQVGSSISLNNPANAVYVEIDRGVAGSSAAFTSSAYLKINQWNHVAVTFANSGKTCSFYINGVAAGSSSNTGFAYSSSNPSNTLSVGTTYGGYLANLRISDNVRTGLTTLPTAPYTSDANTKLLCNFTNAGIPDAAMMNDLETVGNAQVSTSVKKYGTGSLAFDGSGDYLSIPSGQSVSLGTGDFTIECWVYLNAYNATYGSQIAGCHTYGTGADYFFNINTTGKLYFQIGSGSGLVTSTSSVPLSTWTHIALVRSGNAFTPYINGVNAGGAATSTSAVNSTRAFTVGDDLTGAAGAALNGYIDDLRITKGYARYTSSFTPPTAAFPTF